MTVERLREWLEHSPVKASAGPSDLMGFLVDGIKVCSVCSGRLMARGCRLGDKVEPIWDEAVICDVCEETVSAGRNLLQGRNPV